MGNPAQDHAINYIEFTTTDIGRAKSFYGTVFGWKFTDWGPDYISFEKSGAGIDGGFHTGGVAQSAEGAPLVVLYAKDLQATQDAIEGAGGTIVVSTFEFPGGRRFHFSDGCGNVLAVWSE